MARIKYFELGAQPITVRYVKKIKGTSDFGYFLPANNLIYIRTHDGKKRIHEMQILLTLLHEVAHAIGFALNRRELLNDDIFVDNIAQMFLQFLKTRK